MDLNYSTDPCASFLFSSQRLLNLETAVGSQKSAQALGAPRSLSKIRPIYCGCAGFGQIFRSFSLNSHNYSPQTIETSDSNQHPLVTIANLGQAPRKIKNFLISTEVTTDLFYFTMHTNILHAFFGPNYRF